MKKFYHTGKSIPWSPSIDPDDTAMIKVDWSRYLEDGELITGSSWITTLTTANDSYSATITQVQVSGGTVNTEVTLTNRITTSDSNQYDRTMTIPIRQK